MPIVKAIVNGVEQLFKFADDMPIDEIRTALQKKLAPVAAGAGLLGTEEEAEAGVITKGGKKFLTDAETNVVDVSDIFGTGSKKSIYKEPDSGGTMSVLQTPQGKESVLELYVPDAHRRQGVGEALQRHAMQENTNLQGQVSSKHAAKSAYKMGRRPYGKPDATLEDVYKAIDEMSSVNMVSPEFMKGLGIATALGGTSTFADTMNTMSNEIPNRESKLRPENQVKDQDPKTFTESTDDFIADGLAALGLNKHRTADNAEMLNMIAGFQPTLGAVQLGTDVGYYVKKAKDYLSNNYIGSNPLFDD